MDAMNLVLAVVPATPLRLPEATGGYMKNIADALGAVGVKKRYIDDALGLFEVRKESDISDLLAIEQGILLKESGGRWQAVWHLWSPDEPLLWSDWCGILDEKRRRPAVGGLPEWVAQMPREDNWAMPLSGTTLTLSFASAESFFADKTVEAVCALAPKLLAPFSGALVSSLLCVVQMGEADELLMALLPLAKKEPALHAAMAQGLLLLPLEAGLQLEEDFLSWQEACSFCHWLTLFRTLLDEEPLFCRQIYDVLNHVSEPLALSRMALAMNKVSLPSALSASIYEKVLTEKSRRIMQLGVNWALR